MNILTINNLCKSFLQNKVIDDLSFSVPKGSIYGFLGQNGTGKTTTMKMVLGLLKADSGEIFVCDEKVKFGETSTNRHIGFLPDVPQFYNYMKPKEYLTLCGEITGLDKKRIITKSEELLALVGLTSHNKRISSFSRGMKQRLGIAQALLNEPKLLICDEPTSALDPIGRKEILDIMLSVKEKTTIIFSTHILSDVEQVCDNIGVLNKGKLVLSGTIADLKKNHKHNTFNVEFVSIKDMENFINDSRFVFLGDSVKKFEKSISIRSNNLEKVQRITYDIISSKEIYPEKTEIIEPTIENLFMEVVK